MGSLLVYSDYINYNDYNSLTEPSNKHTYKQLYAMIHTVLKELLRFVIGASILILGFCYSIGMFPPGPVLYIMMILGIIGLYT